MPLDLASGSPVAIMPLALNDARSFAGGKVAEAGVSAQCSPDGEEPMVISLRVDERAARRTAHRGRIRKQDNNQTSWGLSRMPRRSESEGFEHSPIASIYRRSTTDVGGRAGRGTSTVSRTLKGACSE